MIFWSKIIKIEPIICSDHDNYYNNSDLIKLVELCLDSTSYELIYNVLLLIKRPKLSNELLNKFKENPKLANNTIYDDINQILINIYDDKNIDNLRGTFLELIIYKYLDKKYDITLSKYAEIGYNCFVEINGKRSEKTVDIFALCSLNGFICECKINAYNLDEYDISNLNKLYINSQKILKPHIITLSYNEPIKEHLTNVISNSEDEIWVNTSNIKIISLDNFEDFIMN